MSTPTVLMPTTLVAVSGPELQAANLSLIDWLRSKIVQVQEDVADLEAIERKAMERAWERGPQRKLRRQAEESLTWYQKLLGALEAGYTLMPDLQMRLFAIRRPNELAPPRQPQRHVVPNYGTVRQRDAGYMHLSSSVLPAGEGAYVGPEPKREVVQRWEQKGERGEVEKYAVFESVAHRAVALPVALVKPQLVEATDKAMRSLFFDEIGVCVPNTGNRKGDPLILGRIYRDRGKSKAVCFVIGWFVQVRDLL